ncbi:hypothetical protein FMEXI_5955 [Fusarium mexicanum]|uniref:PA14 domain-containing protein n=1 Tax=Fusarium mexicanum TaxID=751941 RepID=A0A8H5IZY5_9HYPO|nr:hypothetical protein FMEXI_5955 [Fusarium mexicanum]
MARQLVAVLAAALAFSGVSAGPCKPVSSLSLSSTVIFETTTTTTTATSHETLSSTITADVTETTVTGATTGTTATTDAVETTITESATDTATTAGSITTFLTTTTAEQSPEQSTTTTAGPVGPGPCLEEQILYNPGFDDSNSNAWPWDLDSGVALDTVQPRSPSNVLVNYITSDSPSTTFSQALPALGDYEYELVYYIAMGNYAVNNFDFRCYATTFVNGKKIGDSSDFDGNGPFTYQRASGVFTPQNSDDAGELRFEIQCEGGFRYAYMRVDDVSLTRRCGE